MKGIIDFEEFVKEGIVKIQSANKSRAEFLVKESTQSYQYLLELIEKMGVHDINANDYVKKC